MEKKKNEKNGQVDVKRRDVLKLTATSCLAGLLLKNKKSIARSIQNHSIASDFVPDEITNTMIKRAKRMGVDLVFDREVHCAISNAGYGGITGVCCFHCQMGPCTVDDSTGYKKGACGATADMIVGKNLLTRVLGGAAAHVEHMRAAAKTIEGVAKGKIKGYKITDKKKLDKVYKGLRCRGKNKALSVAKKSLYDLNRDKGTPNWLHFKANKERIKTWKKLGIIPSGAGATFSEAAHRTHLGVDNDMTHLALGALKLALVDGYMGLHGACDLQDILFGTPKLVEGEANLTVIKEDCINIVVNGHEPILSEKILEYARKYKNPPKKINIVGMCCTGNELLMRRGVALAGSMVQQELAILTGAVEAMIVDVQCIMPNIVEVAKHFHTKIISTNPQAKFTGATHIEFEPENADEVAAKIVDIAVKNYKNREHSKVFIPKKSPEKLMAGFSVEQIIDLLKAVNKKDPLKPLKDAIFSNKIRGVVAIVGCVSPRVEYGYRHTVLTKRLIENDILVIGTGCWSHVAAQRGFLRPDPEYKGVGEGLKSVLKAIARANNLKALPPCWHMGSCVDNGRLEDLLNPLAKYLKVDIKDLPVAASAPEFITEKAVSIGTWAVCMGVLTHIGGQPYVSGSKNMVKLLTQDLEKLIGARFYVEEDPEKTANYLIGYINQKRKKLGLPV